MPIEHRIDRDRRLVLATGRGTVTDQDVFGYQREVWSRPEVAGYDELIDMTAVARIDLTSADRVMELARLSAEMDPCLPASKLAIVAPGDFAFGLGRMYQAHRSLEGCGAKQVGVFRSLAAALAFLGLEPQPRKQDRA